MTDKKLKLMVVTGLMAALVCVATIAIQVPMPLTNGYVNLGDCMILAAAWLLGPWSGFVAGAIGSVLADVLTGYAHYAPATFIIKGAMAVVFVLVMKAVSGKGKHELFGNILGGIAAELLMVAGYFLYAWLLLGKNLSGAATSVPGNLLQGAFGVICGVLIIRILAKMKIKNKLNLTERKI